MKNTFNQDIGKLSNIHDHNGKLRALKEISKMSKTHAILDWLLFQLNFHQRLEIFLLLKLLASRFVLKKSINPLSPDVHIQILQTDLYTFC